MKHLKTFGLAAVAAMALTAFVGAGTASATVLCSTAENPCGASSIYGTGTTIEASLDPGTSAVLETTGGLLRDTCAASTMRGNNGNMGSGSETIWGVVSQEHLTFSSCTNTTKVLEGGELEIHWISGGNNGTVTAKGFEVTAEVIGENCIFTAGKGVDLGTATGGSMATVDVNAVLGLEEGSGVNCPSTSRWTANYTVTSPEPLYIAES